MASTQSATISSLIKELSAIEQKSNGSVFENEDLRADAAHLTRKLVVMLDKPHEVVLMNASLVSGLSNILACSIPHSSREFYVDIWYECSLLKSRRCGSLSICISSSSSVMDQKQKLSQTWPQRPVLMLISWVCIRELRFTELYVLAGFTF
jgi:hypothetical protein